MLGFNVLIRALDVRIGVTVDVLRIRLVMRRLLGRRLDQARLGDVTVAGRTVDHRRAQERFLGRGLGQRRLGG